MQADYLLHRWLCERQELIVILNVLCHHRPFSKVKDQNFLHETLQYFCQLLIDYISKGHFKIFEHIYPVQETQNVMENILCSTHAASEFNDKYHINQKELNNLETDLGKLASQLAQRFEWEDKLVECYRKAKMTSSLRA